MNSFARKIMPPALFAAYACCTGIHGAASAQPAVITPASSAVVVTERPCPTLSAEAAAALQGLREMALVPGARMDAASIAALPGIQEVKKAEELQRRSDWPNLCRYKTENAAAVQLGKPLVVFMGSSTTENWVQADPTYFRDGVIGRGIGGQTSPQMLLRFYQDVIALQPKVVHILAGTNDLAANTGIISDEEFKNNIRAMVDMAQANGIGVVLASMLPVRQFPWAPDVRPAARIIALNSWLKTFAAERGVVFADYHAQMTDEDGGMLARFGNDGVHPNRDGYRIMRAEAERAIAEAALAAAESQ